MHWCVYIRDAQPAALGPDPAPEIVLSGPRSRLKNIRNVSWITEILWMNLNFIELLAILQLITIQNNSDGNYIKPQAVKRLVKFNPIPFFVCDSQNFC